MVEMYQSGYIRIRLRMVPFRFAVANDEKRLLNRGFSLQKHPSKLDVEVRIQFLTSIRP